MSEEGLSEVTGRASKDDTNVVPLFPTPTEMIPTIPRPIVYLCHWDRPSKPGERMTNLAVEAADPHEAAMRFAKECDHENPRPPARRTAIIRVPAGPEYAILVKTKTHVVYETFDS